MEYTFVERAPEHRGPNWFGHHIELYVSSSKRPDLIEFLEGSIGRQGTAWRMIVPRMFYLFDERSKTTLRFKSKSDAIRFKLSWDEEEAPESSIDFFKKLALNSNYGGISRRYSAPANPLPWYDINSIYPSIYPTMQPFSGKTLISQVKSRANRSLNPCNEIFLDYESAGKADDWLEQMFSKCDSWMAYNVLLDAQIKKEEASAGSDNVGSN